MLLKNNAKIDDNMADEPRQTDITFDLDSRLDALFPRTLTYSNLYSGLDTKTFHITI